jgi:alpha-N-arabinofuranosidase
LIGVNWGRGWVIEDNDVAYSICSGISLGKYHDPEDKGELVEWTPDGDTYHGTIKRALLNGWDRSQVGGHRVRGNHVSHCEMAGIVGSFGAIFSEVTGNVIHHIHVRRSFGGYEMGGIKFHGAIDTRIAGNHIHNCEIGLWLDWMSQGTRVSGNLFHDNRHLDLYMEVNHGPFVIDHNVLLSKRSLEDVSEGGLYAHNLFGGTFYRHSELQRTTPYHREHSTEVIERLITVGGENRFFNNVFVAPATLEAYADPAIVPSIDEGNVFLDDSKPIEVRVQVEDVDGSGATLRLDLPDTASASTRLVDTARAGTAKITGLGYYDVDGSPLRLTQDCLGRPHNLERPLPGPFAEAAEVVRFRARKD